MYVPPAVKNRYDPLLNEFNDLIFMNSQAIRELELLTAKDVEMLKEYDEIKSMVGSHVMFSMFLLITSGVGEVYYLFTFFKTLGFI